MCYTSGPISTVFGPHFGANTCPNSSFPLEVNVGGVASPTPATPAVVIDLVWYPNSDAMAHITNNTTHFNSSRAYHSSGNVIIGNGYSVPISQIDDSLLNLIGVL